jgi:conjugative relaxase-like TrwC/TraI family protein
MLTVEALTTGKGDYYLAMAREDYYLKGGEPRGRWLGEGAEALGLTGLVEERELKALLEGFSPDGEGLIQNAGDPKHQAGWDLTFSCPKSVSTLWSQAEEDVRKTIQDAQAEAVKAAIEYLQDSAAFTRRGKGGHTLERVKLLVSSFEHGTSRADDPQLHTHCLIMNVGVGTDGKTRTILSKPFYTHKMAAGAVYRAELANQLERRLGVELEREPGSFAFVVKGVPESLSAEFSKRRAQVEMALLESGASGARAAAHFALTTRPAKGHRPRSELISTWHESGLSHGFTSESVNSLLMKQVPRYDLAERVNACIQAAVKAITRHQSHFAEREIVRHASVEAQLMGISAAFLRDVIKQRLASLKEFVSLGQVNGEIHYTTPEMLALEKTMLDQVEGLKSLPSRPIAEKTVCSVERALSDEQKKALRHLTQSSGQIQIVSGMAGTGKTSMLRATREAFEREGFEVLGACLSGKAAQGLEEEAGIKSSTLAKLLGIPEFGYRGDLEKGFADTLKHHTRQLGRAALGMKTWKEQRIRLTSKSILIIDEAGMVGTRQMQQLAEKALAAGARLILVGDERQLQAVECGGPFASIGTRVGRVTLTDIKRQREAWAREAVKKFAFGAGGEALREYARRGFVSVADSGQEARQALMRAWKRKGEAKPKDNLILASTNAETATLNRMAQTQRMLAGRLGVHAIAVAGSDFYCGDRVLFTRNSKRYGVQNGSLGTVVGLDEWDRTLTVKLDKGKRVFIPTKEYEHVKLGYAVTTHKSQGATTENAFVLLGGPTQDRELSYVQASRARGTTRFFLNRLDAGENLREICKQVERSRQKDLAHDILEREGRENRERQVSPGYRIG